MPSGRTADPAGVVAVREAREAAANRERAGRPDCPAWVADDARDEWYRITEEMDAAGTLAKVDRAAIAEYCIAWAESRHAERMITEHGYTTTSASGELRVSPWVRIRDRNADCIRRWLCQFELTPAARGRRGGRGAQALAISGSAPDALQEFLSEGGPE